MIKKIFLMAVLFVAVVSFNVYAFEIVEEQAPTLALGLENGHVISNNYISSFYGVTGHYSLSENLAIKGVIGYERVGTFNPYGGMLFVVKPAYMFLNTAERGIYTFAHIGNLGANFLNAGVGFGFEYTKYIDGVKLHVELGYSLDQSLLTAYGFKIGF